MKLKTAIAAIAAAFSVSCIDFDLSQQAYCESLTCQKRVEICADGPQITKMEPDRSATSVALDTRVTVTFSEQVTCTATGVTLVQYTGGEPPVAGTATCTGNTAVFTPSAPLLSGRVYKVYVNDCEITNAAGLGSLDASWTFTTR